MVSDIPSSYLTYSWMHCAPCDVMWTRDGGDDCWLCGHPGEKTQSPLVPRGAPSLEENPDVA